MAGILGGSLRRAMSSTQIAVALVGPGAVGRAVLEQMRVEVGAAVLAAAAAAAVFF